MTGLASGTLSCSAPHTHSLGRDWRTVKPGTATQRSLAAAAKKKAPKNKSSGDNTKFGAGDDPEDALPSDYIQFSRLIGEAPAEAEQRLSRKQRMSLGKPPDAEASEYLLKWKKQLADEAAARKLAVAFFEKENSPASAEALANFRSAAGEAGADFNNWLDDPSERSADGVSLTGPPRRRATSSTAPDISQSGGLQRPSRGASQEDFVGDAAPGDDDFAPAGPPPSNEAFEALLAKPQGAKPSMRASSSRITRGPSEPPALSSRVRTRVPRTLEDQADEALRVRPARRSVDDNPLASLEEQELRRMARFNDEILRG
ncbi:hypothetical protein WJX74_003077 [Apatococcus lobatus]|uniref:Uncharacterized protein n=1 Tax=Apatococcus lobatus TaxID=904363 RepID=A0AAW1RS05_9CHLO